jgi:hypothetical protein
MSDSSTYRIPQPISKALHLPREAAAVQESAEDSSSWTTEAEFVLSALEAAGLPRLDRRDNDRIVFHTTANLRLYSEVENPKPWQLFVRDVTPRGLGFISRHRLPLGYGGMLHLRCPRGAALAIDCAIRRCRAAANGWFEGAIAFNRPQSALDPENFLLR